MKLSPHTPTLPMRGLTSFLPAVLLSLFGATPLVGQGQPQPGFRIHSNNGQPTTHLIDELGQTVHTWTSTLGPGMGVYVSQDGTLLRAVKTPGGYGIGGEGGGVQRLALDGTVLWDFRYDGPGVLSHHDIAELPNGNLLIVAFEEKSAAQAVAAGRNPATMPTGRLLPDHVIEVQPTGATTGTIVWEWHIWDHLIQDFDASKANFGVVGDHPELIDVNYPPGPAPSGDWTHMNSIDYHPEKDWIVMSVPYFGEVWVIDHSTTTAQAAGHGGGTWGKGGDLLYRWGNPEAYDRGGPADKQLVSQHGASFIDEGLVGEDNIILFNNRATPNSSAVWELELPLDSGGGFILPPGGTYGPSGPVWEYSAPNPTDMFSQIVSNAERLANGHTLVCSGAQGWLFEIDATGQKVWEYFTGGITFHTHLVERTLWADQDQVSTSAGGAVGFDLIAGADHVGERFLMLGSLSGTTPGLTAFGLTLPLNLDAYLLQTLNSPNGAPLSGNFGALDGLGKGSMTFALPPLVGAALAGLTAHHAYALLDPATFAVTHTSNAVPILLTL